MKTNEIFYNIFHEIDYKGKYLMIIEKLYNRIICSIIKLLNIYGIKYYKPLKENKGFII